ncbi:MAG: EAL domain-containing protein [Mycobacteriales bacterium]
MRHRLRPIEADRLRGRAASALLAGVLLSLTAVALWSALETRWAATAADRSHLLAAAYQEARFQVAQEESYERKYRLEPSPEVRRLHIEAGYAVYEAMLTVMRIGGPGEAAAAQDIIARNDVYQGSIQRLFSATDDQDFALARNIDEHEVDPLAAAVQTTVYSLSKAHDQEAAAAGLSLRRAENVALGAIIGGFAVGLVLVAFVLRARQQYDRHIQAQSRESERLAREDPLTGLPNRLAFAETLDARLAALGSAETLGVVLLDLDRFKEINDTLGHQHGDRLLALIGPRMREVLRGQDIIARLGGDEFVLLLHDTATESAAGHESYEQVAERVLGALMRPFTVDDLTLVVEASAGLAVHPADGSTPDVLLQRADIAMYVAKAKHQRVIRYEQHLDEHSPRKLGLLAALRRSVLDDELLVYYQPILDLNAGGVVGVEALVRWQHPTEGLLAPDEFIPLAEGSGFIHALTDGVLRLALAQSRIWRDQGLDLTISVNLSTRCLLDSALPESVSAALDASGVAAERLMLEITESAIVADPIRAFEVIARLHALGVQLSIDDFGTGYTSMRYLRDLPVRELKIDRSFVSGMMTDPQDYALVQTSIDLGRRLGLRTVAEGVEDEQTWRELTGLGCDAAQGYLFLRPLPAREVGAWIAAWQGLGQRRPESAALLARPR